MTTAAVARGMQAAAGGSQDQPWRPVKYSVMGYGYGLVKHEPGATVAGGFSLDKRRANVEKCIANVDRLFTTGHNGQGARL